MEKETEKPKVDIMKSREGKSRPIVAIPHLSLGMEVALITFVQQQSL